jgi:hypothetical protein
MRAIATTKKEDPGGGVTRAPGPKHLAVGLTTNVLPDVGGGLQAPALWTRI